jgi:hypothetical protein
MVNLTLVSLHRAKYVNLGESKSFGFQSADQLSIVSEIIREDYNNISDASIKEINSALNNIPFAEAGALDVLDNSVKKNNMTPLQRELILMQYEEMKTSDSREEISSIVATFEYEVANSAISEVEKRSLLTTNAMVRNTILENKDFSNTQYSNVAWAAPIAVVAIFFGGAILAYEVGYQIGLMVCPNNANYYNCAEDVAGVSSLIFAIAFPYMI